MILDSRFSISLMLASILTLQESEPWRLVYGLDEHFSIRDDGSDRRKEKLARSPKGVLSPDGKRRVTDFHFPESQPDIWVTDADGRNAERLIHDLFFDRSPQWTADGKRIVWESMRAGNVWQIWIMDADGKNPKQLTDHPGGATQPLVSPAGDVIAYREEHAAPRQKLPPSTLRTMDFSGRDSKVVMEKTEMLGHTWSPKGDRLAVSLIQELRVLEMPAGKAVRSFKFEEIDKQLYAHAAYGMLWRPDGKAIACTIQFLGGRREGATDFGDDKIFILPFEGKPVVIEAGGPAGPVRWIR